MAKRKRYFRRVYVEVSQPSYYVVDVEIVDRDRVGDDTDVVKRAIGLAILAVRENHQRLRPYHEHRQAIARLGHFGSQVTNLAIDKPGELAASDPTASVVEIRATSRNGVFGEGKVYAFAEDVVPEDAPPEPRTVITGGSDADQS